MEEKKVNGGISGLPVGIRSAEHMKAEDRRNAILQMLRSSDRPLSASYMAAVFSVSRQIIVGDVALLRAAGTEVRATPRGYILENECPKGIMRRIVCRHSPVEMEKELMIFVDNGCSVMDVIVEHPLYGQLTGELSLSSRYDVQQFVKRSEEMGAKSLCMLTDDIHIHTLKVPDEAAYARVSVELQAAGILYEI